MAYRQPMPGEYGTTGYEDGGMRGESERSLGELFRELADGASTLMRQEVALAKAELKESTSAIGKDVARIGIAAGVLLVGVLCLVAFAVVALGDALDNYWLSALIMSVVFLAIGGIMAKSALKDMKQQDLKPEETIQTLKADKAWAREEVQDLKRRIRA